MNARISPEVIAYEVFWQIQCLVREVPKRFSDANIPFECSILGIDMTLPTEWERLQNIDVLSSLIYPVMERLSAKLIEASKAGETLEFYRLPCIEGFDSSHSITDDGLSLRVLILGDILRAETAYRVAERSREVNSPLEYSPAEAA